MKRKLMVAAAAIMALALFGCGGAPVKDDASSQNDTARMQELMDGMVNSPWENVTVTAAVTATDKGGGFSKTTTMETKAKIDATGDESAWRWRCRLLTRQAST